MKRLLCLTLGVLFLNYLLSQNPFGSYRLDGNASDFSGNNLHGTITGPPVLSVDRNGDSACFHFDGTNDYVVFPSAFDFSSRSIILWFYATSVSSSGQNLIYSNDGLGTQNGLTSMYLSKVGGVNKVTLQTDQLQYSANVNINQWYQAAIVRTPTEVRFYLNGVHVQTSFNPDGTHSTNGATSQAIIGANRSYAMKFIGRIDDVNVYNFALPNAFIVNSYNGIDVDLGADQTLCNGSQLILTSSVSGGTAPFTYAWSSTGDSLSCYNCANPGFTLTQNSTYTVTVTDVANKKAIDTVSYTGSGNTSTLQLSLNMLNALDCTHPEALADAIVSNAIPPLQFNWGDGTVQQGGAHEMHGYTTAGVYVVSVVDSSGCAISAFDTVISAGVSVSVTQAIQPACAGDKTGKLHVSASGGTAPYTYLWNTGKTTAHLDSVDAGAYSVIVRDVNNCSTVFDYILMPTNDVWGYYVFLTPTAANCGNNGSIVAAINNGTPPFTYLWSNGSTTQALSQLSGGVYNVTVSDSTGCPRIGTTTVPTQCVSVISGSVFIDNNQNCVKDSGEAFLSSIHVHASANGHTYHGTTNNSGTYYITVPDTGTYELDVATWSSSMCANFSMCNNPTSTIQILGQGDSSLNNNFVSVVTPGFDLTLHPGWTNANPGFNKQYWMLPYNDANIPFNGQATVVLEYDSHLVYQFSAAPLPVHDSINHTLTWTLDTLPSLHWDWTNFRLVNVFHVPLSLSVGMPLTSSFYIYPTSGDCDSSNNVFHFNEIVTGSLDPNEKEVEPKNSIDPADSILNYKIHFQNCGTDSTWFVIIRDTLSEHLDVTSVKTVASSHPYSNFTISGTGILTWTFDPLRLVDSITNEEGSKGFVAFTIKKKPNLPLGTIINNSASIYFDYNTPVKTNTVSNVVADDDFLNCNVDLGQDISLCSGQTATLNAGPSGTIFHWNNNALTQGITVVNSGVYSVTISNVTGCQGVDQITVSIDTVSLTVSSVNTSCGDDNGSANANLISGMAPLTYVWNTGASTSSLADLAAGTYSVTVTSAYGCTSASSATVAGSVKSNVQISANQTLFCSSDSAQICATQGFSAYQWNNGGSSACINTQSAGNYYVTATDINNCTVESNHISISTHPVPSISVTVNGDTMTCSSSANLYQWYRNGVMIAGATSSVCVATQSGNYTVMITDNNGCQTSSGVFQMTVGLEDLATALVRIFPNPSEMGRWTLYADQSFVGDELEICDNSGRIVYTSTIVQTTTPISLDVANGVYFLKINSSNGSRSFKLIKL